MFCSENRTHRRNHKHYYLGRVYKALANIFFWIFLTFFPFLHEGIVTILEFNDFEVVSILWCYSNLTIMMNLYGAYIIYFHKNSCVFLFCLFSDCFISFLHAAEPALCVRTTACGILVTSTDGMNANNASTAGIRTPLHYKKSQNGCK